MAKCKITGLPAECACRSRFIILIKCIPEEEVRLIFPCLVSLWVPYDNENKSVHH